MKPVPMTVWHVNPRPALEGQDLPREIVRLTLDELCRAAGILCRVSGGTQDEKRVVVCEGDRHFQAGTMAYVGVPEGWRLNPLRALRVLETLAYAFHDYEARECVSFRGLFVAHRPVGRPSRLGRARTDAERMRDMRARRKQSVV
jgi:hypothetical protein